MERAWSDFQDSLSKEPAEDEFTTKFRYQLEDDAIDAVNDGIEALKQCAPLVVVFNQEFSSISIETPGVSTEFNRKHIVGQDELQKVTVSENENGNYKERKFLLAKGEMASIAVPLQQFGEDVECLPIVDTPRLFLGFPLIGTEDFSFPAVINSLDFTPTENRDGVFFWQANDEANHKNQKALIDASDLLIDTLRFVASAGWRNAHLMAKVPAIQKQSWLDPGELRGHLTQLTKKFRETPVVINESGQSILPEDLELPIAETAKNVESLWDLLDGWKGKREFLPRRIEAAGWCDAVKSWASLSDLSFDEVVIDGRGLAANVCKVSLGPSVNATTHRLSRISGKLHEGVSVIDWLDQLIAFLNDNGLSEVVREYQIVPSQEGFLRVLPRLHRDDGIHEELKNVAHLLDWRIRTELRDIRVTVLNDEVGLGDWNSEYVFGELMKKLQQRAEENPDDKYAEASVRLFAWIVGQRDWDRLRGFPVFAGGGDVGNRPVKLERDSEEDVRPLAPVLAWEENLQSYSELFPWQHIVGSDFFEAAPDPETWEELEELGFLRRRVVITKDAHHDIFLPDELNDEEHKTAERVTVTDVAFMTRDDVGIMARVRQSQRLARIFWRFMTEWLTIHDREGLERKEALCDCGDTHNYFSAEWLNPLTKNKWVPIGGDTTCAGRCKRPHTTMTDGGCSGCPSPALSGPCGHSLRPPAYALPAPNRLWSAFGLLPPAATLPAGRKVARLPNCCAGVDGNLAHWPRILRPSNY